LPCQWRAGAARARIMERLERAEQLVTVFGGAASSAAMSASSYLKRGVRVRVAAREPRCAIISSRWDRSAGSASSKPISPRRRALRPRSPTPLRS
jgi:hypothetical protein